MRAVMLHGPALYFNLFSSRVGIFESDPMDKTCNFARRSCHTDKVEHI